MGEGYLDIGVTPIGGSGTLTYGLEENLRDIKIESRIPETAVLFSGPQRFSFPIEIQLSTEMDIGIGLLGASRTSHFAKAAGVFALIGMDRLVIGERDSWDNYCEEGGHVAFFPVISHITGFWTVAGSVTANSSGVSLKTHAGLILDTGAVPSYVTSHIYDHVLRELVARGAEVGRYATPHTHALLDNCPADELLPTIAFTLGEGPTAVDVELHPADYIIRIMKRECLLALSGAHAGPGLRVVGMNVLSRMVTVFDARNDRVGFCIARS